MKHIPVSVLFLAALGAFLAGCDKPGPNPAEVAASRQQEADTFNAFLARAWEARLADSPQLASRLGRQAGNDRWDDVSVEALDRRHFRVRTDLANMLMLDYTRLDAGQRLSYELFGNEAERRIELHRWRLYPYVIEPHSGLHTEVPAFLMTVHDIRNEADAEAYIARLRGIQPLFQQAEGRLAASEAAGIVPPKFVFPQVASRIRTVLIGRPFDRSAMDSALLNDFTDKVAALGLPAERETSLVAAARTALVESVQPAYESLARTLNALEKKATNDIGAWKLPSGDGYYRALLRFYTTSDLSPGELHEMGLAEVARLEDEVRQLAPALGLAGSLPALFKAMGSRPGTYYPDTEAGRAAYLKETADRLDSMRQQLGPLFSMPPDETLVVQRVARVHEPFVPKVFYESGADQAAYYVNVARMGDLPKHELEPLAYYEGLPGRHLERSTVRSHKALPDFRRSFPVMSFTEGWALYAARLAREAGGYATPEAEYGRLVMELNRAVDLVVDTGIHAKRWTREDAIKYMLDHTPLSRAVVTRVVERRAVQPAQGAASAVGLLRILELRQRAATELGERFDLREFHDALLGAGPVPLNALSREVNDYIERKRSTPKAPS